MMIKPAARRAFIAKNADSIFVQVNGAPVALAKIPEAERGPYIDQLMNALTVNDDSSDPNAEGRTGATPDSSPAAPSKTPASQAATPAKPKKKAAKPR